jgi:hypothetical protein
VKVEMEYGDSSVAERLREGVDLESCAALDISRLPGVRMLESA